MYGTYLLFKCYIWSSLHLFQKTIFYRKSVTTSPKYCCREDWPCKMSAAAIWGDLCLWELRLKNETNPFKLHNPMTQTWLYPLLLMINGSSESPTHWATYSINRESVFKFRSTGSKICVFCTKLKLLSIVRWEEVPSKCRWWGGREPKKKPFVWWPGDKVFAKNIMWSRDCSYDLPSPRDKREQDTKGKKNWKQKQHVLKLC